MIRNKRKNRTRTEIMASILESANGGGSNLQKLMYDAYLSHGMLKDYLTSMTEYGFIECDSVIRKFRTTPAGMDFLRTHSHLIDLMTTKAILSTESTSSLLDKKCV